MLLKQPLKTTNVTKIFVDFKNIKLLSIIILNAINFWEQILGNTYYILLLGGDTRTKVTY